MNKYWSELAGGLVPYVPGEQPKDKKYIKLNTNENPYGPSPLVLEAIRAATDESLRLYPDPDCSILIDAAAKRYGVKSGQVFAGNGSDEVLAFSFMAFFNPGKTIVFPDITYSFYPVYASLLNLSYRTAALDGEFNVPVGQLLRSEGGVVLANPNAPTGRAVTLADIRRIVEGNPESVVIIDEAYVEFGCDSAIGLINEYPNLLVVRTLSKSHALAGMRVGLAFGDSNLIKAIVTIKNSFNSYTMDRLAIAAGAAALGDCGYYAETSAKIIATRERFTRELRIRGFFVADSSANFVFASHPRMHAEQIFKGLRDRGILVRYFKKPPIDNFLRISIGTNREMDAVTAALDEILAGSVS